jgi:hypothetical protein
MELVQGYIDSEKTDSVTSGYLTDHLYLQLYLSCLHLSFYFVFNQDAVHIIKAIMHKIPDSMNFNVMVLSRKRK